MPGKGHDDDGTIDTIAMDAHAVAAAPSPQARLMGLLRPHLPALLLALALMLVQSLATLAQLYGVGELLPAA